MKTLFISDTHWELKNHFEEINFNGVELIVFLWDNETSDIELFKDIQIKKVWILGNHPPWEKTKIKIDIFKEFQIEDISWKEFNYKGIKFFWIPGEMKYIVLETIIKWQTILPSFSSDKIQEINTINEKISLLHFIRPDIILSHFPAFGIMDKPKDLSHRGLKFIKDHISEFGPKMLIHGHLHKDDSKKLWRTKIQQVFIYKIIDL